MNNHGVAREMFPKEERDGFIYFAQLLEIGPVKIGFSKNVRGRLASLQAANPYKLNLLYKYPASKEEEKDWFLAFDDIRLKGEWFLAHPDLLREIRFMGENISMK